MKSHRPPHIYLDNTWYMISAATKGHSMFLSTEETKAGLRDFLKYLVSKFGMKLRAWVILDNHYHLLIKTARGQDLSSFIGQLHGSSSREVRLMVPTVPRPMWLNYWDTCIREEEDLWSRFNYIHQNPVKHGYVRKLEEWPFSSYHYYLRVKGSDWLGDCWERYPPIDFLERDVFRSEDHSRG